MFKREAPVNTLIHMEHTINEHRAPTDDSVRLLKEFEEKAREKINSAVHILDTTFDCVVQTERDHKSDCTRLRAIFSLNGIREVVDHEYIAREPWDEISMAHELRDKVAVVIATKMINAAFDKLYKTRK